MKKILETINRKWAEYLLEIIVIMIGILGAYALNNWNEERKNRHQETDYLKAINEEFKKNKEQFDYLVEIRSDICNTCDKIATMAPITVANWDSIYFYYNSSIYLTPRFAPSTSSIESLINNASFDIIRSDSLRSLLIEWDNIYNDWKEEENDAIQSAFNVRKWIEDNVKMHWTDNNLGTSTIINFEKLYVLQNLIQVRCGFANYILQGDQNFENETVRLKEAIDRIILLSQFEK